MEILNEVQELNGNISASGKVFAALIGQAGPKGEDGTGLNILGIYNSLEELKEEHPIGKAGEAYRIGSKLYVWNIEDNKWIDIGDIQGPKGDAGPSNVLTIGTVTSGTTPSASITGKSPNQILNLVLPKGDTGKQGNQGETGLDGQDGFSPTITTTSISNGTKVSITDVTGTKEFNVMNGEQGPQGEPGPQGDPGKDAVITDEIINQIKLAVLQAENPVGHIRMETTNTNPATYLGFGTWVLWGSGKVPVGVDTNDSSFNTVEKTGGSKTVNISHTHTINGHTHTTSGHTLTVNEIPSHYHEINATANPNTGGPGIRGTFTGVEGTGLSQYPTGGSTASVGGGQSHSHGNTGSTSLTTNSGGSTSASILQPYITCYMWKRTQ